MSGQAILKHALAKDDLARQAAYIARDSVSAARRFLVAAEAAFEQLAQQPGLGSVFLSSKPGLQGARIWPVQRFRNHLVFYRASATGIEVLRVMHAASDWQSALE